MVAPGESWPTARKNIKQTNSHKKTNNKQAATNKQPPKKHKKQTVL